MLRSKAPITPAGPLPWTVGPHSSAGEKVMFDQNRVGYLLPSYGKGSDREANVHLSCTLPLKRKDSRHTSVSRCRPIT